MPRYPRSPSNLALCRVLCALPDLHRLRPYWQALRRVRAAVLRQRPGCTVGDNVTLHEGFYFTSSLRLISILVLFIAACGDIFSAST